MYMYIGRYILGFFLQGVPTLKGKGSWLREVSGWTVQGHSRYFWVGVCCWDSDTFSIYHIRFSCILWPYSRLDAKSSFPIPDLLFSRNFISVAVSCLYGKIMVPYSRLKFPDLYTLSLTKQLKTPIILSGTYLYSELSLRRTP